MTPKPQPNQAGVIIMGHMAPIPANSVSKLNHKDPIKLQFHKNNWNYSLLKMNNIRQIQNLVFDLVN